MTILTMRMSVTGILTSTSPSIIHGRVPKYESSSIPPVIATARMLIVRHPTCPRIPSAARLKTPFICSPRMPLVWRFIMKGLYHTHFSGSNKDISCQNFRTHLPILILPPAKLELPVVPDSRITKIPGHSPLYTSCPIQQVFRPDNLHTRMHTCTLKKHFAFRVTQSYCCPPGQAFIDTKAHFSFCWSLK